MRLLCMCCIMSVGRFSAFFCYGSECAYENPLPIRLLCLSVWLSWSCLCCSSCLRY
jgi:hypothetical protein